MKESLLPVFLSFLLLALPGCGAQKMPELIPREVLFGNPEKSDPQLSPDGKKLAYLAPVDNVLNVWIRTVGQQDDRPVTRDKDRGVRQYFWQQDSRAVFYLQDTGGKENWRLYKTDPETLAVQDLTPFEDVQVRIIEYNKFFPAEMLLAINKDNPKFHDVYHLDLKDGTLKVIARNPGDFQSWLTDYRLRVRGALRSRPEGGFDLLIRDSDQDAWKAVTGWDLEDSSNSGPVSFSKDGRYVYLTDSQGVNASRLVKLDLGDGKKIVLAEDPVYDISGVMINPDSYEIEAVSYNKEREEWTAFAKAVEEDFAVFRRIGRGDFFIASRDKADDKWIVGFYRDDGPTAYYLYDRKAKKTEFLFDNLPKLKKYRLGKMEPFSFLSRDGLTIHGYITYPVGKVRKGLPAVLNVHGGPWTRDSWGYSPRAQWFANRGYACIQVNYRGSTGYGKDFINAGNKEWGGKMHQDILDAVDWAGKRGIIDRKRTAIFGGSYGGYESLVGAAFSSDIFACAISIVGPSNLITFLKSTPPYWESYLADIHQRVGDPDKEVEFLKSRSPFFRVQEIRIPVFIAQGENDPRVNKAESEQIVNAMKQKGIYHEYMLFSDEGHGFAKPQNRLKFYAAAERFLARCLGGRYEE